MDRLSRLRREIRGIDLRLLRLARARLDRAKRVGAEKHRRGLPLRNYEVEADVIRFARRESRRLRLPSGFSDEMMRLMIRESVRAQEPDRARRRAP